MRFFCLYAYFLVVLADEEKRKMKKLNINTRIFFLNYKRRYPWRYASTEYLNMNFKGALKILENLFKNWTINSCKCKFHNANLSSHGILQIKDRPLNPSIC